MEQLKSITLITLEKVESKLDILLPDTLYMRVLSWCFVHLLYFRWYKIWFFFFDRIWLFFSFYILLRVFLNKFLSNLILQLNLPLYFLFRYINPPHLIISNLSLLQQLLHLPSTELILLLVGRVTHFWVFKCQFFIKQNSRLTFRTHAIFNYVFPVARHMVHYAVVKYRPFIISQSFFLV